MASKPKGSPIHNLATLASFIDIQVAEGIQAFYVTMAADGFFLQYPAPTRRQLFQSHPANTLPYRGMKAIEERAAINVVEWVRDKEGHFPLRPGFIIRGISELRNHRDALGHPSTVKWKRPEMGTFTKNHRHLSELRAGIIWDIQKSINEELVANGKDPFNADVTVTLGMAEVLHLILCQAIHDRRKVPQPNDLAAWMLRQKGKYIGELERVPQGWLPGAK